MTKTPARKQRASLMTTLAEPPRMQTSAPDNIKERKDVDLNFKVPDEFKRDFKIAAIEAGLKQRELLFACFDLWKEMQAQRK